MEGCGCVKRVSKGKYQWLGRQENTFLIAEDQKGDPTSLRQISSRLKSILSSSEVPVTFKDLN